MSKLDSHLPRNLPEWLSWIEKLHPEEVELGLARVRVVAERLGLLEYFQSHAVKVITIAGTNGKGSTAALLERMACLSNLSVGCFTSPHFLRYNERIRINGVEASDDRICQVFSEIVPHTGNHPLTYFEYGALAALQAFREAQVELVILEVGLGGRLDAVNVVDADIAVITSIGIDHQDWLGDNREQIGREKAGILRMGCPVVCGESNPPASVTAVAAELAAPCYRRDSEFSFEALPDSVHWQWRGRTANGDELILADLPAPHIPRESVAAALQAIALLDPSLLVASRVRSAISNLKLPGRFFRIPDKQAILDVAHNPDAASYLSSQLAAVPISGKIYAIFAAMGDKDLDGIVSALKASIDFWYGAELDIPRAASNRQLSDLFERQGIDAYRTMPTVKAALLTAQQGMTGDDMLLVVGSFFTAAAALEAWGVRSLGELTENGVKVLESRTDTDGQG